MAADIETGYPSGYHALKRKVANQVHERLNFLAENKDVDIKTNLLDFIRVTSLKSGLPEKSIIKIIIQTDSRLQVLFQ